MPAVIDFAILLETGPGELQRPSAAVFACWGNAMGIIRSDDRPADYRSQLAGGPVFHRLLVLFANWKAATPGTFHVTARSPLIGKTYLTDIY